MSDFVCFHITGTKNNCILSLKLIYINLFQMSFLTIESSPCTYSLIWSKTYKKKDEVSFCRPVLYAGSC